MRHTWPLLSPEAIPLRCLTAIVMVAVGRCVSQAGGRGSLILFRWCECGAGELGWMRLVRLR